jgi:hypothetical protein
MISLIMSMSLFLSGQEVAGRWRFCYYQDAGTRYIVTIPVTELCPLEVDLEELD